MKKRKIFKPILILTILSLGSIFCTFTEKIPPTATIIPPSAIATPTDTIPPQVGQPQPPISTLPPILTSGISFGEWTAAGLNNEAVLVLAISPDYKNDSTLVAGGDGKVWKTTDAGNTWTDKVPAEGKVVAMALSPDFANDQTIFAAFTGTGLYKSTDGGDSWSRINDNTSIESMAISPDYADDHTIFFGGIGAPNSGVFRSQDGGNSWTSTVNGLSNVFVFSLAVSTDYAKDHTVFAGTNGFLFESSDAGDNWNKALGSFFCMLGSIRSIAISPNYASDGIAYGATEKYVMIRRGNWNCPEVEITSSIQSLSLSPDYSSDQSIFAGTSNNGFIVSSDFGNKWTAANNGLGNLDVHSLAVPSSPTQILFAATEQGVWKNTWFSQNEKKSKWNAFTTANGLLDNNVNAVAVDKAGHLWFGCGSLMESVSTLKMGASEFDGSKWTTYNTANGLVDGHIHAITVDEAGHIWFGTDGGVSEFDGNKWANYTTENSSLHSNNILSIAVDKGGDIWVGDNNGASKFDGSEWKFFTVENTNTNVPYSPTNAITVDDQGRIWFGTEEGISEYDGQKWYHYDVSTEHLQNIISDIAIDQNGYIWAGTWGGVGKFNGDAWTIYTEKDGLEDNEVHAVAMDAAGHIWIGTAFGGVGEFDGSRWTTYTRNPVNGLVDNWVNAIAVDGKGHLWFGTNGGVSEYIP